jgi:glutathione S-transferase
MADELVLYTNPMSRGRVARWMLEEVGQPYRAEILEYARSMKTPEYLAINPGQGAGAAPWRDRCH